MSSGCSPTFIPFLDQMHPNPGGVRRDEDAHSMPLSSRDGQDNHCALLFLRVRWRGAWAGEKASSAEQFSPACGRKWQILAQELGGSGGGCCNWGPSCSCAVPLRSGSDRYEASLLPMAQAALDTWRQTQTPGTFQAAGGNYPTPIGPPGLGRVHQSLRTRTRTGRRHPVVGPPLGAAAVDAPSLLLPLWPNLLATGGYDGGLREGEPAIPRQSRASKPSSPWRTRPTPPFPPSHLPEEATPDEDGTVRVPVKQINQLSDLSGNSPSNATGWSWRSAACGTWCLTLQTRMRNLDHANGELRSVYDRVATQGPSQAAGSGQQAISAPAATPPSQKRATSSDLSGGGMSLPGTCTCSLGEGKLMTSIIQSAGSGGPTIGAYPWGKAPTQTTRNLRKNFPAAAEKPDHPAHAPPGGYF